jgi:septum formation inhibitor MinC
MSKNYRYKEKYNNSNIRCTSKSFGGDPNRGIYKQCFCDDIKFINIKKIKADNEYNRQQEIIRRNKRRLRLLAIQRRRALQQEKERRERLIRQRAEAERRRQE